PSTLTRTPGFRLPTSRISRAIYPDGYGRTDMLKASAFAAIALAAALWATPADAQVIDLGKYPDWSAQWSRVPDGGVPRYDPSKPIRKQEAPLKPEYQARFEASMRDQDAGGMGLDMAYSCRPPGMPRMMAGVALMEFLISPSVT